MVKKHENAYVEEKPRIFLALGLMMLGIAVLAYAFEDTLYQINYTTDYFLFILIVSVALALFFLFCFQVPDVGNRILGRTQKLPRQKAEKVGTVTYNVFSDTTASSVKMKHQRRKTYRQERKKYAQATKPPKKKK